MESHEVTASNETLMRQAGITADVYLADAIAAIDERLGKGAAAAAPALVGAYMQAAALDYQANIMARSLSQLGTCLSSVGEQIENAVGGRQ